MSLSAPELEKRPAWLSEAHELPHRPVDRPLWVENYLNFVNSPGSDLGIYLHMRHVPGAGGTPGIWDEIFYAGLPDDQFLVSRAFARGQLERESQDSGRGSISIAGLSFTCDEPFRQWTKRFHGAARLVSGDELRRGPLTDGKHVEVEMEMTYCAMSPVFDYPEGPDIQQAWGSAHYEQHHEATGHLTYEGVTLPIEGTGLRDHSWGVRDFPKMGGYSWIIGQFPESGRSFMICYVTATPPHYPKPLLYTVVSDRSTWHVTGCRGVEAPSKLWQTEEPVEFELDLPDGSASRVRVEITKNLRAHFLDPSEFAIGTANPDNRDVTHHYIPSFARVWWDGELGNGYHERAVAWR
jgi:hypothetical protein